MSDTTPKAPRASGGPDRIRYAVGECSLGTILVAESGHGVCAITMGDDADELLRDLERRFPHAEITDGGPTLEGLAEAVACVEQPVRGMDAALDVQGTPFQRRVWRALREVPAGETVSYAELARRIGTPGAARAVAQACAANPLAVAIPCHRVVRSDGSLSGYRWGVERKRTLLQREGVLS